MAHYNLYQRFSLNQNEDAATIAARLDGLLQSGSLPDYLSEEEVRVAQAVLGNEQTRALYDAKLKDPAAPEITFDAVRELANAGFSGAQVVSEGSYSPDVAGAVSDSSGITAYPGDSAYSQAGNNQQAGFQQGSYPQADSTSYGSQATYADQYGQQYSQYGQGYSEQNGYQSYQGYPGQYQQAGFQQSQYQTNQYPGNPYAGQYPHNGQYPQMPGYPVNAMPPRDIHEQSWADPTYRNATTGARVGAYFIDQLIVGIPISIIVGIMQYGFFVTNMEELYSIIFLLMAYILYCVVPMCYKVCLEAKMGATLGKKILRLRLISTDGQPIGFSHATKRNAMQLCLLIPVIGILFPGIDNLVRFISVAG